MYDSIGMLFNDRYVRNIASLSFKCTGRVSEVRCSNPIGGCLVSYFKSIRMYFL